MYLSFYDNVINSYKQNVERKKNMLEKKYRLFI